MRDNTNTADGRPGGLSIPDAVAVEAINLLCEVELDLTRPIQLGPDEEDDWYVNHPTVCRVTTFLNDNFAAVSVAAKAIEARSGGTACGSDPKDESAGRQASPDPHSSETTP